MPVSTTRMYSTQPRPEKDDQDAQFSNNDVENDRANQINEETKTTFETTAESIGSAPGFQSLSGLFPKQRVSRYSRSVNTPREALQGGEVADTAEGVNLLQKSDKKTKDSAISNDKEQKRVSVTDDRLHIAERSGIHPDMLSRMRSSFEEQPPQAPAHVQSSIEDQTPNPAINRRMSGREPRTAAAARSSEGEWVEPSASRLSSTTPPWSIARPTESPTPSKVVKDTSDPSWKSTSSTNAPVPPVSDRSAKALESQEGAPVLTHLTSTGEAHMVDVTGKASTNRVAIAHCHVRFSNDEPFRLISENSHKKGDVLGVARIAGIMAAKRCSDIVPLCHPIPITKVAVNLRLRPPGENSALMPSNAWGVVYVEATVHCHGPTGVEMEALTAVMGAALTVYDMCKAVDRSMTIGRTEVVMKTGGKSGTHVSQKWEKQKQFDAKIDAKYRRA